MRKILLAVFLLIITGCSKLIETYLDFEKQSVNMLLLDNFNY